MDNFLRGAIAMGFGVAALFFLRFWKETRDRLFAAFALAFFILAGNRALLLLVGQGREEEATSLYLVRLLAFVIILVAIVDKNLRPK